MFTLSGVCGVISSAKPPSGQTMYGSEGVDAIELSGDTVILYARALLFCLCFTGVLIICAVFPEYIITLRARSTKKLAFMCTKQDM